MLTIADVAKWAVEILEEDCRIVGTCPDCHGRRRSKKTPIYHFEHCQLVRARRILDECDRAETEAKRD